MSAITPSPALLERLAAATDTREIVEGELLRRSFHKFIVAAWPVLEPGTQFKDNWHIGAIAEHLEAVARGELTRLIINMPPRFAKSTLVSVLWPAWIWANDPTRRFLSASYAKDLATRDSVNSRRLMESEWYQKRYSRRFAFTSDQNVKTRYENDKRGYRVSTSVDAGATGEGGDFLLIDDPLNAREAVSPTVRETAIRWWQQTMSTRYNDPKTGAAVLVMQRLAEDDLTGFLLKEGGWEHLCFPMRYEPERTITTSLGFVDPRTAEGELLFEDRFDEAATVRLERELGSMGTAGQLQQRPAPKEGAIFKYAMWQFYHVLPEFDAVIISVDCAFKDHKSSDFVAIQVWGARGTHNYLIKRVRKQLSFTNTVSTLVEVVSQYPAYQAVLIEDKANGPAVIDTLRGRVSGIIAVNPEGGKTARAQACAPDQEAGCIWLPHESIEPGVNIFLAEVTSFPAGRTDDEVDAMTQALIWLQRRHRSTGLLQWMEELAKETKMKGQLSTVAVPAQHDNWVH